MVRLSVNINKVATLRNARGGEVPCILEAVRTCVAAGVHGITIHPRKDQRHIRPADAFAIAEELSAMSHVEFNIEGDPRPDLLAMVHEIRPQQCTLVPVTPGEITSQAGWPEEFLAGEHHKRLTQNIHELKQKNIRVSLFVAPTEAAVQWAAELGADRVELYTEPYARAYEQGLAAAKASLAVYERAAMYAASRGLGVNAGHDLNLENLPFFATLPHLDEVSIGHALIARAMFMGLGSVVRAYIDVLANIDPPAIRKNLSFV